MQEPLSKFRYFVECLKLVVFWLVIAAVVLFVFTIGDVPTTCCEL